MDGVGITEWNGNGASICIVHGNFTWACQWAKTEYEFSKSKIVNAGLEAVVGVL